MRVYIAGPYTTGDTMANIRTACSYGDIVARRGHAPMVPHLSGFMEAIYPQGYETWMRIDLAWLAVADAVIRIPGHSPGADREVDEARRLGIPVFEGLGLFLRHNPREITPAECVAQRDDTEGPGGRGVGDEPTSYRSKPGPSVESKEDK